MTMVQQLLGQLARISSSTVTRVIVTHNIQEPSVTNCADPWPFRVDEIFNSVPQGFGRNHNAALSEATEDFFCVLNPDVQLHENQSDPLELLIKAAAHAPAGCAYPVQLDGHGTIQDSERSLPTPKALCQRRIFQCSEQKIDWVNAACLVLPRAAWKSVNGFDEKFYMYCEDVDFCLRLQLNDWSLKKVQTPIIHAGQRASHRQWKHLFWHVKSLIQLWSSESYKNFQKQKNK